MTEQNRKYEVEIVETLRHVFRVRASSETSARMTAHAYADKLTAEGGKRAKMVGGAVGVVADGCLPGRIYEIHALPFDAAHEGVEETRRQTPFFMRDKRYRREPAALEGGEQV